MSNSMFRSVNRIVPVKFILFKNNKFFIKKKDNFLKKIAPICVLGMFI